MARFCTFPTLLYNIKLLHVCTRLGHTLFESSRTIELQETGAALHICNRHRRLLRTQYSASRQRLRTRNIDLTGKSEQRNTERWLAKRPRPSAARESCTILMRTFRPNVCTDCDTQHTGVSNQRIRESTRKSAQLRHGATHTSVIVARQPSAGTVVSWSAKGRCSSFAALDGCAGLEALTRSNSKSASNLDKRMPKGETQAHQPICG